MKTLLFAQHTHLGAMFETQSSLWICTWCSLVLLLTLEYEVHVIFIPLDLQKVSRLEKYRNWYSTNSPCTSTREVILVQFSHNLYVQKMCPNSPVIRSLIYPFIFTLCPIWYILSTNSWKIIQLKTIFKYYITLFSMQGDTKSSY